MSRDLEKENNRGSPHRQRDVHAAPLLVALMVACLELVVKELENPTDEKKKGKDIGDLVVHCKDKTIRIMDVKIEKYNCIELFRDARTSTNESGIEFSKLTNFWKDVRSKYIPICIYDLKKPTDNQKHVESLDKISVSVAQPLPQAVTIETK
ncbi:hypothetical protein Cgig2_002557 [Carnegiea gigantea]|uniref:Uncharacterized protein n=1 Tax=Carnegiea gigantea TaxID=171969 RepID=A0A9Q1JK64_9CARY|nr:hypothetical protein Cgig2_002557 [Carnegiea gigantea]